MATKPATAEKIGRVGRRRQVVIPREMLENLNFREGALWRSKAGERRFSSRPSKVIDPDDLLAPLQAMRLAKV